ncbi:MAG: replication-relaxation family protein [Micrococcales bacterium]|nr:replication-relaxation family protein [Micrococcales bacterium]MCL2667612.1 replication-relaxation family protein [Micrococcales bacterium]
MNHDIRQIVGRRQLALVATRLGTRDWQVLNDLARFRLLHAGQIRRLHFDCSKHASRIAAARACTSALRRLSDFGLIRHLERRIGGVRAGSDSLVWHLAPAGVRLLTTYQSNSEVVAGLVEREPSLRTATHTLTVAEVAVCLREVERTGQVEVVALQPEPACWREHLTIAGTRTWLKPDLFAITATAGSAFEELWFIEVDLGTESAATIARKAVAYDRYRQTGREQAARSAFPLVAWLAPDEARAETITSAIYGAGRSGGARDGPNRLHRAMALEQFIVAVRTANNPI